MNTSTQNTSDRNFVAMANEALGRMDVPAARRLGAQLEGPSAIRRLMNRLHLAA